MPNLTIAAVVGSLKSASVNRSIVIAASGVMPNGVELIEASVADGVVTDAELLSALGGWVERFVAFVERQDRPRAAR
jgi:hypothetical protein